MPIGGRSIPSDVPAAIFWSNPQRTTSAGTRKAPPPIPNMPDMPPIAAPIARKQRKESGKGRTLLEPQGLAADQHRDVRVRRPALDDGIDAADPLGRVAIRAEAGGGARGGQL